MRRSWLALLPVLGAVGASAGPLSASRVTVTTAALRSLTQPVAVRPMAAGPLRRAGVAPRCAVPPATPPGRDAVGAARRWAAAATAAALCVAAGAWRRRRWRGPAGGPWTCTAAAPGVGGLLSMRRGLSPEETAAATFLAAVAPPLDGAAKKGDAGRVGVLGGSADFTGAPYYAGKAALYVGCDLLYMFTAEEAAIPLKSYSPELMVTPVYSARWPEGRDAGVTRMVATVERFFPRLTCLVVGPGLGREDTVLEAVAQLLAKARDYPFPVVIDADGLWLIQQRPDAIRNNQNVILTPNVSEYKRLVAGVLPDAPASSDEEEIKALAAALGHVTVCRKGAVDLVSDGRLVLRAAAASAPKRSGGIGDILSGSIGVVAGWAVAFHRQQPGHSFWEAGTPLMWAAVSASAVVRRASLAAFQQHRRATVAPNILDHLGDAFEALCPADGSAPSPHSDPIF